METVLVKLLRAGRARIIVLVAAAFVAGLVLRGFLGGTSPPTQTDETQPTVAQAWTCSMHPQIRQPKPGKCPICFMDLVPVSSEGGDIGERQISFSEAAIKLPP
ncbi:MAG: heavy metal-binding domain-containing protein [Planctomycetota bacterium]|jgi:Cu(I)/Ag(I) efflux system membrane fusion protein